MEKFGIENEYLTSVTVQYAYTSHGTECKTTSNVDHPSFAALREHLQYRNLILIERKWWNGDRVLENFVLNDFLFHEGDKFPSAGAMKYHIKLI